MITLTGKCDGFGVTKFLGGFKKKINSKDKEVFFPLVELIAL